MKTLIGIDGFETELILIDPKGKQREVRAEDRRGLRRAEGR